VPRRSGGKQLVILCEQRTSKKKEPDIRPLRQGLDRPLDFAGVTHRRLCELDAQGRRRGLDLHKGAVRRRLHRIVHEGDARDAGRNLLKQLHLLRCHPEFTSGEAGNVAARLRQARHKALADRIGDGCKQNRDHTGRPSNRH
jgi:hypothetical protein